MEVSSVMDDHLVKRMVTSGAHLRRNLYIYKRGPWLGSWTAAPKMGSFFVPVNSTVRGSGRRLLNWSKSHWFGHPRAGASPMFQKVLVP